MSVARWLWHFADSSLCLLVFFPSMVFYWRGIWDLFGVYISPSSVLTCNWVVFGIGCLTILEYFLHPAIRYFLQNVRSRFVYVIISRVYMYFSGVILMAYWRGVWTLADYYLQKYGWQSGLVGLLTCYPLLVLSVTSRSVIFPPFIVNLDTGPNVLVPSTKFQTQVNLLVVMWN